MKPRLVVAAAAACLAVSLTACGSGGDSSSSALAPAAGASGAAGSAPTGRTTITFWSWVTNMKPVVDAFNAGQQDVFVNYEETPSGNAGGYAKLSAAVKAGSAPDVATIEYPLLPTYVSQGAVQPLDDATSKTVSTGLAAGTTGLVTLGGKVWAAPYDTPPMILYYRKDMYEQAGVTSAPETWQEFADDAAKLKQKFPNAYAASFYPNDPTVFAGLAQQAGAKWFGTEGDSWNVSLTDAATTKVAGYWQDLVSRKLVKPQQSFSDDWSADLKSGNMAGVVGASWSAAGIKSRAAGQDGKWAVAPLPSWSDAPASALLGGSTFAITKDSKNVAAADKFVVWMTTNPDAIKARGQVGSALLAHSELTAIAKTNFDTAFFGKQDIYAVYEGALKSVAGGWAWGPTMAATNNTAMGDAWANVGKGGTIADGVQTAQTKTVENMKSLGLSVTG